MVSPHVRFLISEILFYFLHFSAILTSSSHGSILGSCCLLFVLPPAKPLISSHLLPFSRTWRPSYPRIKRPARQKEYETCFYDRVFKRTEKARMKKPTHGFESKKTMNNVHRNGTKLFSKKASLGTYFHSSFKMIFFWFCVFYCRSAPELLVQRL